MSIRQVLNNTEYLPLWFSKASATKDPHGVLENWLILFSLLLAYIEAPLISDYLAPKNGVRGLFKSLCHETYPNPLGDNTKLRVNNVVPTLVRSPMTEAFISHLMDKGFTVAEIKDAVDVVMRLVCDADAHGRAVAVLPGGGWDLCDDRVEMGGVREGVKLVEIVRLGEGPRKVGCYQTA